MNSKEYIKAALTTETDLDGETIRAALTNDKLRLLHSALGMATEASEFADIIKKHIFYGREFDKIHAQKEVGDILWYIAIFCDVMGVDFEALMQMNIEKLKARYADKFTREEALNRKPVDI